MSQLETIMLVTLGLVVAALLVMFIGRMVWSYRVALGKRRTERSAPATIAGLQAERDELRAKSAMQTRKLELRLDDLKTRLAEQTAEVSRNRNRIDHLVKEIEKRDEVLSERDEQIEQLNHHVEPLEAELTTRTQAIQQLKEQLRDREDEPSFNPDGATEYRIEIAERDKEIARLREEVANREARQQEISIEAETAQERLQSQIRELTALSGQIEKQRSDMSDQYSEFAKPQVDATSSDAESQQEQPAPIRTSAVTSTKPSLKQTKPPAKKTKATAKKTKPGAQKSKPATRSASKKSAKKVKPAAKTAKPADSAIRSEAESAKFASEAARSAARNPRPAAANAIPAPENGEQGSILAAMRKKSIGLSGNSPDSISRAGGISRKLDGKVNFEEGNERETGQLQDELKQLDAVWAKKIAALNNAAPKTISARARAATVEKALAKSQSSNESSNGSNKEPSNENDQSASSRSRQNVISLAARIRALQKNSAEN